MENRNAYELLEVESLSSLKEITKAYRTKALKYHPDKLTDKTQAAKNEKYAKMFQLVKQAYDLLLDPVRREELDSKIRAEQQRKLQENKLSLQRKQMKFDLEARESHARNKGAELRSQKIEEEIEVQKFRMEMERAEQKRIRKIQQESMRLAQLEKEERDQEEAHKMHDLKAAKELEELEATIRLRWVSNEAGSRTLSPQPTSNHYNSQNQDQDQNQNQNNLLVDQTYLKQLGSLFGQVEEVVMSSRTKSKTNKRSALLVFSNIISAHAFMEAKVDRFPQLDMFERSWAHSPDSTKNSTSSSTAVRSIPSSVSDLDPQHKVRSKLQEIANLKLGRESNKNSSQSIKEDWLSSSNVASLYANVDPNKMPGAHMSFSDFEAVVLARMRVFDQ